MDTDEFLSKWFVELPWTVVGDVCSYLDPETVAETLLKVPRLRHIIIDQYYSQELHLILSPTKLPHFCTSDLQRKEIIDIVAFGEIEDFLVENSDIVPRSYRVITSGDFRSMEILLRQFHARLSSAPRLEIYVDHYELRAEDLELIFSFPNLYKFQTSVVRLRHCLPKLVELLPQQANLQELVFLGHAIENWSNVRFPPNLSHLDMSWFPGTHLTTVSLPDSLRYLYWNQSGIDDRTFEKLTPPPHIKTLMLTYSSLSVVNVSHLPQTLETIDFSYSNISGFEGHGQNPAWPPSLKSILLHENLMDDTSLKQLSAIGWPPFLENLRLDNNRISSLEHLSSLPSSLKYLDLSDTRLRSFAVAHNDDRYPYFRFPESLETLSFQGCSALSFGEVSSCDKVPLEHRIRLPPNLASLNLTECNLEKLAYFVFPSSLRTLSLTGNRLRDLTTYNLAFGSTEVVNWRQLTNLRDLELYYNRIENLHHWCPPKTLRRIDLGHNEMKKLTPENTPLFSGEFREFTRNLQTLSFEENAISEIAGNLVLPRNLVSLNLSKNRLASFVFTDTFANHRSLVRLDLAGNKIDRIGVESWEKKYSSHLKEINLSKNAPRFHMTTDEFYGVFEHIGLTVTKRKQHIRSEHVFK